MLFEQYSEGYLHLRDKSSTSILYPTMNRINRALTYKKLSRDPESSSWLLGSSLQPFYLIFLYKDPFYRQCSLEF